MLRKRIKKITKLTFLIAVRQIWKLIENLYHLLTEPFLALKKLGKDRDKSQIFLIILTVLSPIIIYILARIFWDYYRYKLIITDTGMFFKIVLVLESILFFYLGYWTYKLYKKK